MKLEEKYYIITKAEADLIGRFNYSANEAIDPYVGEQKDGTYLVSDKMYNILKDHPKLSQINFTSKTLKEKKDLDVKPVDDGISVKGSSDIKIKP